MIGTHNILSITINTSHVVKCCNDLQVNQSLPDAFYITFAILKFEDVNSDLQWLRVQKYQVKAVL